MFVACILAALAAILLVLLAGFAYRKFRLGAEDGEPDGATSSHTGAMLSALFLLVYAIALILPWTTTDEATKNTRAEAHALTEAYWSARGLPQVQRDQVQSAIKAYTSAVINDDWPEMADHKRLSAQAGQDLNNLRKTLYDLPLKTDDEKAARDDTLERIKEVTAARAQRSIDADASLPTAVLAFTVVTGVVMIVFPFLAGARPRGWAFIPLGIMAALLGSSIYLAFNINHTFSGALKVDSDAFKTAQTTYSTIP